MYLGMDVAKLKLDCCLLLNPQSGFKRNKTFANSSDGIKALLDWLDKHAGGQAVHGVMEGAGVYRQLAADQLFAAGVRISIVNPAQARDFAKGMGVRTKNDRVDSFVLACFCVRNQPPLWAPPPRCHQPGLAAGSQSAGKSPICTDADTGQPVDLRQYRLS